MLFRDQHLNAQSVAADDSSFASSDMGPGSGHRWGTAAFPIRATFGPTQCSELGISAYQRSLQPSL
jgi:hypothetical protein